MKNSDLFIKIMLILASYFLGSTSQCWGAGNITFSDKGQPSAFLQDDDYNYIPVIIVANNAPIRKAPSKSAATLGKAKFLDSYYLTDHIVSGTKNYYLAAEMTEYEDIHQFIGWFAEEDILIKTKAIKKKGIYSKALIVNKWQAIAGKINIESTPALNGPSNTYNKIHELGLFKFYFIYAKATAPHSGNEYYLLGHKPFMLDDPAYIRETLIGWVPKQNIHQWDTRQAVEFDKRTLKKRVPQKHLRAKGEGGVKIFKTENELEAFLQGKDRELMPIATEDTWVEKWQYNWQRFPLIKAKSNERFKSAGQFYQVGYIGDQIYIDSGLVGASSEDLDKYRHKLEELRHEARAIDLIFVIDSTGSMKRYFSAVSQAVKRITQHIERKYSPDSPKKPDIRYSVLFYRDYPDEEDSYLIKRLPLTANVKVVTRFIEEEKKAQCGDCGGDAHEAVFHAIDTAITATAEDVRDRLGFKAIILIGDTGNHNKDPRGYTAQSIAKTIKYSGYEFFSIHVVDETQKIQSPSLRAFKEQTNTIHNLIAATSIFSQSNELGKLTTNEPNKVAETIVKGSHLLAEQLIRAKEAALKVEDGEIGIRDIKTQYGVILTKRLTEMMIKKGIDPKVFLHKSAQIFGRGWLSEKDHLTGQRQVREVLLVDRVTLEQLMAAIAGMIKAPPTRRGIMQIWTKVLKDVTTGDVTADKSVTELIENHLGIPLRKKLLKKSLYELSRLSSLQLEKLLKSLEEDMYKIRGIYNERQVNISRDEKGNIKAQFLGNRKMWWRGGGFQYAWIPIDELP
jgi:hypothetical protein